MFRRIFRAMLPLVVIAACISVRFERPLFANSATLYPTFDVTTDSVNITNVPYLRVGNLSGLTPDYDTLVLGTDPFEPRSIVKFDVSSIPINATVTKATLKITQQDLNPQGLTTQYPSQYGGVEVRGINATIVPETATALELYNAAKKSSTTVLVSRFSDDGFYPNAPGTFTLESGATNVFGLLTRVQGWVNGTIPNRGMTVRQESEGFTLTGRQFVSSNVQVPITGDANFDGVVNSLDVQAWQSDFRFQNGLVFPRPADFDYDWDVDGSDFLRLQRDMGKVAVAGHGDFSPTLIIDYTLPAAGVGSATTVPEPAAVVLASVGSFVAFSLLKRRASRSRERYRPAIVMK